MTSSVITKGEIEQIVGRERRERVSQLAWCGGGCFDSRRRVNSTVRCLMDPAKASALSRDAATPLATLQELAGSDLPFLRENVARHPHATPELLLKLVPSTL